MATSDPREHPAFKRAPYSVAAVSGLLFLREPIPVDLSVAVTEAGAGVSGIPAVWLPRRVLEEINRRLGWTVFDESLIQLMEEFRPRIRVKGK